MLTRQNSYNQMIQAPLDNQFKVEPLDEANKSSKRRLSNTQEDGKSNSDNGIKQNNMGNGISEVIFESNSNYDEQLSSEISGSLTKGTKSITKLSNKKIRLRRVNKEEFFPIIK